MRYALAREQSPEGLFKNMCLCGKIYMTFLYQEAAVHEILLTYTDLLDKPWS